MGLEMCGGISFVLSLGRSPGIVGQKIKMGSYSDLIAQLFSCEAYDVSVVIGKTILGLYFKTGGNIYVNRALVKFASRSDKESNILFWNIQSLRYKYRKATQEVGNSALLVCPIRLRRGIKFRVYENLDSWHMFKPLFIMKIKVIAFYCSRLKNRDEGFEPHLQVRGFEQNKKPNKTARLLICNNLMAGAEGHCPNF
jgi:hypothetical protein